MPEVATVLRGLPRICAALGFGAAGTALSMVWWIPIIFHARGVTPFVLFIDAPGISAAVCGWALRQAVARSRPSLPGQKRRCSGPGIATLALVLFAPLFSTLYVLSIGASLALHSLCSLAASSRYGGLSRCLGRWSVGD
jgi:hypothetical protein